MDDSEQGERPSEIPAADARSRGHRRAAAREKAQLGRRRRRRLASGSRWAIRGVVGLAVLAAVALIVVLVRGGTPATGGPSPANMAGDGITIGKGLVAERTGSAAATAAPTATSTAAASDTVHIVVYLDYLCPMCASFEKTNGTYIEGLLASKAATVTYHPLSMPTTDSDGSDYSKRAANTAACVANFSPDSYFDVNRALFDRQPKAGAAGLTNAQLRRLVQNVDGLKSSDRIARCITSGTYEPWVADATQRATDGPISDASITKIAATPTILVNGQEYKYSTPFTVDEFRNFVVTAAGNSYSDNASASATPTPTPTATGTSTASPKPSQSKIGTPAPN